MGHKKKGQLTADVEYAKHFRKYGKRKFWKKERKAADDEIKKMD
jgi:hypothetical protein